MEEREGRVSEGTRERDNAHQDGKKKGGTRMASAKG